MRPRGAVGAHGGVSIFAKMKTGGARDGWARERNVGFRWDVTEMGSEAMRFGGIRGGK